ncbi:MAG: VTT domain-containing protein [Candidatus Acidiferrales bacterium]|jgi:membrane protein YqaA with SNARE-associated domain
MAGAVCENDWRLHDNMLISQIIAAAAPTTSRALRRWVFGLGGLGFIPLGLVDSSIIPVPGSMDVLTIVLSARNSDLWVYYAVMATVGSVIGAYVTYRLARRGGKATLGRKVSPRKLERAQKLFGRWGFGALAIAAVLPPPVPIVPVILAAGAMHYSSTKFLSALTMGRIVRYSILGYLGARYGRHTMILMLRHLHYTLIAAIALVAISVMVGIVFLVSERKNKKSAAA